MYKNKKDLIGKTIRVIIWGRNAYSGAIQCETFSIVYNEDTDNLFYKNGKIHYDLRYPCITWRALKRMKHHYVFNSDGVCVSHPPKKWLNKPGAFCRYGGEGRKGLPYAEITIS